MAFEDVAGLTAIINATMSHPECEMPCCQLFQMGLQNLPGDPPGLRHANYPTHDRRWQAKWKAYSAMIFTNIWEPASSKSLGSFFIFVFSPGSGSRTTEKNLSGKPIFGDILRYYGLFLVILGDIRAFLADTSNNRMVTPRLRNCCPPKPWIIGAKAD